MDLDRARAVLRPRTPWEGVDLGFALARAWFLPLWALWWLTALPLALATAPWLHDRPDVWLILVWWCKPLFEALPLLWLAAALFGADPPLTGDPRTLAGTLHTLIRPGQPARLLPYLLWLRLAPSRSLDLPVSLLEGLRGRKLRERRRVIHGGDGTAAWLTIICIHLEMVFGLGAVLTLFFLIPEELPRIDLSDAFLTPGSWAYWLSCLLSFLAMSVIGPFYLAAGFALYLTRRTQLEAWDLELIFRRAGVRPIEAPRRSHRDRGRVAALVSGAALTAALALAAAPQPAAAQRIPDLDEARALIAEVLAGADFGVQRQVEGWAYVGDGAEPANLSDPAAPGWLSTLAEVIAAAAEPIKWGLALATAVLLALLLRRILRDLPARRGTQPQTRRPVPPQSLGATVAENPLPQDIPAAARAHLAAGETRAALALLYRAGIQRLNGLGFAIPAGATEGDCLRLAAREGGHAGGAGAAPGAAAFPHPAAELAYLRRLTRLWQGQAYAHQDVAVAEVEALLRHWGDWTTWSDHPNAG